MSSPQQTFVRAIEVWRPDGELLHRDSGAYGQLEEFERASVELTLRKGQGLPGAAWSTMRPEIWHELGPRFLRAKTAQTVGIGAAAALPFFQGSQLVAVVAFYCAGARENGGCIEAWELSPEGTLEHADGYYGYLREFESVSRGLTFSSGVGLPGRVLKDGIPHIIDDLGQSNSFLRARAAREHGVESGLGIPLYCGGEVAHVALFLSASATPLSRAFEVWMPEGHSHLVRRSAFYAPELADFGKARESLLLGPADGLAGRAWVTRFPVAASTEVADDQLETAREAGIRLLLAMPIDDGTRVRAVVQLFV